MTFYQRTSNALPQDVIWYLGKICGDLVEWNGGLTYWQ